MFLRVPGAAVPGQSKAQGFDAGEPAHCVPPILFVAPPLMVPGIRQFGLHAVVDGAAGVVAQAARNFDASIIALVDCNRSALMPTLRVFARELILLPAHHAMTRRGLIDAVMSKCRRQSWQRPCQDVDAQRTPVESVKLPASPPAARPGLGAMVVRDDEGRDIGSVGDVAMLTGMTIAEAHDAIAEKGAINGMPMRLRGGRCGHHPQAIRRISLLDGAEVIFLSASAAAEASGLHPTSVMRIARAKRRHVTKGFAFEFVATQETA